MSTQALDISTVVTRTGQLSLRIQTDSGVLKTLHSLYDPEEEARAMIKGFQCEDKGIIVVLGLGLGYHVAQLEREFPASHIMVIEPEEEICRLAGEHGPDLSDDVEIVNCCRPSEALRIISKRQVKMGLVPLTVFSLASAVSVFPEFYRTLHAALRKTVSVRLWDRLRYPKFQNDSITCLVVDSGYFLVNEVEKALKSLNHDVIKISVREDGDNNDLIMEITQKIVEHKPDFLLTMNHLGFDEAGVLASFLKSIELPAASWYVDSPNLIVKAFDNNVSPFMSLFLWDKTYINDMNALGFESVEYLPLATDKELFRPRNSKKHKKKLGKYVCEIGFVGNSMIGPVQEWVDKNRQSLHPVIEKVAEAIISQNTTFEEIIESLPNADKQDVHSLSKKEMAQFEAAVLWKATLLYRLSCIQRLEKFGITIHGDRGWKDLISRSTVTLKPPLNYYKALPLFYNACDINFNATSRQMNEGVNQRVFDVPACGAFLLTDHQDALNDLFRVGEEIITYSHPDEIPGLVDFYLKHPDKRREIAKRGRERILKEHTYVHRLDRLITSMKERYS